MIGMSSPGKPLLGQQLAQLQLDQVEQLLVVHHVDLVQEDDHGRHFHLAGQQDVLARLGHGAVRRRDHEDGAVHLGRAGDHVLDVVRVAGAVDVGVVAVVRLVLHVLDGDGDTASPLFRRVVDAGEVAIGRPFLQGERLCDRRRQRRLAMVNVTDGAYVEVGLVALELLLCHVGNPIQGTPFPAAPPSFPVPCPLCVWSRRGDSNPQPSDYKSLALPLRHFGLAATRCGLRRPKKVRSSGAINRSIWPLRPTSQEIHQITSARMSSVVNSVRGGV